MSDPQTPPPPPPAKTHLLDRPGSKILFSLFAFLAPVPLAIVIVDFWLRSKGGVAANEINPMYFIKQAMAAAEFGTAWPLLLALAPSALMLLILFRGAKARLIMLALLLTAALLEFVGLAQLSPI